MTTPHGRYIGLDRGTETDGFARFAPRQRQEDLSTRELIAHIREQMALMREQLDALQAGLRCLQAETARLRTLCGTAARTDGADRYIATCLAEITEFPADLLADPPADGQAP